METVNKPKWIAENVILNILTVLKVRFGSVPIQLQNQLSTIADVERLNALIVHAVTCQSFDGFNKLIGGENVL
ncbi:MAG: hypothetical protein LBC74_07560 [Planctomycetaceae bacterium]|nr:hypothetical protein [Planctomycetaceae bacterium]